ncbi:capsule biosynthesis protein [Falsirhodobacter sp. alg1]|uniref:capsule biosynthesis protein n=1 Tax=Falsirhodobacter sp. alg1 TaxID=1472418 RepID=UPI000A635B4E|nr:capsule biosynthesis protein [Falsirhodobacter sp. alg1]
MSNSDPLSTTAQSEAKAEPQDAAEKQRARRLRKVANAGKAAPKAPQHHYHVAPTVKESRFLRRHVLALVSFVFMVLAPVIGTSVYMWGVASNQFASYVSFAVRSETQSSTDMLGGLAALTGVSSSSSSDSEVLYAFFQSQNLVARIDDDIDLRAIWSKAKNDPVFSYDAPGTIEDLTKYWGDMVQIVFDSSTGIIDIRALAFDADDAKKITDAIFAEGTRVINQLSDIAREDAIRYAREDLDDAVESLREARAAITEFRNKNQIVDPTLDTAGQMGIVGSLQSQLATAMVELDMLRQTTRPDDIRISQGELKISVIQQRIEEERSKLGMGSATDGNDDAFANVVGDFERLTVDREFAEQSYTAALAAFNAARAEAGRQSRYLAAHVTPTLAEQSQFPKRTSTVILIALFLTLLWAVAVLVGYSLKDRR